MVPARDAQSVLVLREDRLQVYSAGNTALKLEPLPTLGLRGAGLVRVRLGDDAQPELEQTIDRATLLRTWEGISAFDHHASTGDAASVLGHHREVDCLRCRRDGDVAAAGDGGDSAKHCQHENLHARLIEDVTRPVAMVGHGLEPLNRDGAKNA